jgi:hypothetical protein
LRRALVRFLVESSLEDTQQARVADELLKAVRAMPGQGSGLAERVDRRIEKLEGAVARLSTQLEQLGSLARDRASAADSAERLRKLATDTLADARKALAAVESLAGGAGRMGEPRQIPMPGSEGSAARARPGFLGFLAGAVVSGVCAALLTSALLAYAFPGHTPPPESAPLAAAQGPAPAPQAEAPAPAPGTPPAAGAAAPVTPAATAAAPPPAADPPAAPARPGTPAWQEIWARALQQPVASCPQGGTGTLRKCLCGGAAEDACTLAQAQAGGGASVMIVQALLRAHSPPLILGTKVDGQLGLITMNSLVRLTHSCGKLGKATLKVAQDFRANRAGFDARSLDPILTGLQNDPVCVLAPGDPP